MPTRPPNPEPTGSTASSNPFAGLGSGLDFFQDWVKAAGSALPNMAGSPHQPGAMPAWGMPTLDPQELDKRIQDLRTVQFWLEQNARMIAMTIQGLEVQKMTLSTLQGMNVSMDAVRDALRARTSEAEAAAEPAAPTADAPAGAPEASTAGPQADLINPMRWWDTLTQQFTHLASQTAQTAQSLGEQMSEQMSEQLGEGLGLARQQPARKRSAARKQAAPRRRGGKAHGSDAT